MAELTKVQCLQNLCFEKIVIWKVQSLPKRNLMPNLWSVVRLERVQLCFDFSQHICNLSQQIYREMFGKFKTQLDAFKCGYRPQSLALFSYVSSSQLF